jgi:hypothetical protein
MVGYGRGNISKRVDTEKPPPPVHGCVDALSLKQRSHSQTAMVVGQDMQEVSQTGFQMGLLLMTDDGGFSFLTTGEICLAKKSHS